MGEARRKKQIAQHLAPLDLAAVEAAAVAMRKLADAASSQQGTDCYVHTVIGQHLLDKFAQPPTK